MKTNRDMMKLVIARAPSGKKSHQNKMRVKESDSSEIKYYVMQSSASSFSREIL
jgi:hypothetical protein